MTTLKAVPPLEAAPPAMSTGRRVWLIVSLILSVVVLLVAVAGTVGAWVARAEAIDLVTNVMTATEELATAGREGIARVDPVVADIRQVVGTVEDAANQIAQNVADEGLLLTLLPPEKAQELQALADRTRTTLTSILEVLDATANLVDAIASVPFVNLPQAEQVGTLRQEVQGIISGVEQLAGDVRQFREDTAAQIGTISERASQIDNRLEATQKELAVVDGQLDKLQTQARYIRERFPTWATITAILLTVLFIWTSYGMIHLMRAHWTELQAPRAADKELVVTEKEGEEVALVVEEEAEKEVGDGID